MTYIALSGEPNGDGGDMYTGLDRFGRVIDNRWINNSNVDIDRFKYTFSRASNRLTRQNTVAATLFDEQYVYDNGLYQLYVRKLGTLSGGVITGTPVEEEIFAHDPTGNWSNYTTMAGSSITLNQPRTYQLANEITAISGSATTVGYDANGNMTTEPVAVPSGWSTVQTLTYDAWNRPIVVTQGGTPAGTYQYDGLNRRTWKQSNEAGSSVTRHFYYSNQWQVLEERTGIATTADRQYVWGVRYRDDLVLRDRFVGTTDRLYSLADYFQTTSLANTSGVIQERYVYRGFGSVSFYTAAFATRSFSSYGWTYLYGGYQYDIETSLYQVRNRYYHCTLGRWITRDPLPDAELSQGSNLYWYVQNNAVNKIDSLGLEPAAELAGAVVGDIVQDAAGAVLIPSLGLGGFFGAGALLGPEAAIPGGILAGTLGATAAYGDGLAADHLTQEAVDYIIHFVINPPTPSPFPPPYPDPGPVNIDINPSVPDIPIQPIPGCPDIRPVPPEDPIQPHLGPSPNVQPLPPPSSIQPHLGPGPTIR